MKNQPQQIATDTGYDLELKHYIWLFNFALNDLKTKIAESESEIVRLERFPDEPYVPSSLGPRSERIASHLDFLSQYRRIQKFTEQCLERLNEQNAKEFAEGMQGWFDARRKGAKAKP